MIIFLHKKIKRRLLECKNVYMFNPLNKTNLTSFLSVCECSNLLIKKRFREKKTKKSVVLVNNSVQNGGFPYRPMGTCKYYVPQNAFIRNHDGTHVTFFHASVQYTINFIFTTQYYMVVELLGNYKNILPRILQRQMHIWANFSLEMCSLSKIMISSFEC